MPHSDGRLVGISTSSVLVDASAVAGGTPAAASSTSGDAAVDAREVVVVDSIVREAGAGAVNPLTLPESANTTARVV